MIEYTTFANSKYSDRLDAELTHEDESLIPFGMLIEFPEHTAPFWNMSRAVIPTHIKKGYGRRYANVANKVDVILNGMETMGCACRSVDADQMRESFYTISDGK